jgi:hypothetical protein
MIGRHEEVDFTYRFVEFEVKNGSFSDSVGAVTILIKDFFRVDIFHRSFVENFDGGFSIP